jgi:hypothetical protein
VHVFDRKQDSCMRRRVEEARTSRRHLRGMVGHSRARSRAAQGAVSLVCGPSSRPTMMCIERACYQSWLHSSLFLDGLPIPTRGWRESSFRQARRSILCRHSGSSVTVAETSREGVRNTIQSQSDASCLIKTYTPSSRGGLTLTL